METTYTLGKIDYSGNGRKLNKVTVSFHDGAEYRAKGEEYCVPTYAIRGANNRGMVCGGQCQDELEKYPEIANNPLFRLAVRLNEAYGFKYLRKWKPEDRAVVLALIHGKTATEKYEAEGQAA